MLRYEDGALRNATLFLMHFVLPRINRKRGIIYKVTRQITLKIALLGGVW